MYNSAMHLEIKTHQRANILLSALRREAAVVGNALLNTDLPAFTRTHLKDQQDVIDGLYHDVYKATITEKNTRIFGVNQRGDLRWTAWTCIANGNGSVKPGTFQELAVVDDEETAHKKADEARKKHNQTKRTD